MGKICIYIKIQCNKRKNSYTFNGEQRENVNKAKPPGLFSAVTVEISSLWGVKSAVGGDCE
jgi:hypothetical protein